MQYETAVLTVIGIGCLGTLGSDTGSATHQFLNAEVPLLAAVSPVAPCLLSGLAAALAALPFCGNRPCP